MCHSRAGGNLLSPCTRLDPRIHGDDNTGHGDDNTGHGDDNTWHTRATILSMSFPRSLFVIPASFSHSRAVGNPVNQPLDPRIHGDDDSVHRDDKQGTRGTAIGYTGMTIQGTRRTIQGTRG